MVKAVNGDLELYYGSSESTVSMEGVVVTQCDDVLGTRSETFCRSTLKLEMLLDSKPREFPPL